VRPAQADPAAPHTLADLPNFWDERRHRQGNPDLSTCAADLSVALQHTLAVLRAHGHALSHEHNADAYSVGQARGLMLAHDLLTGTVPLDCVPVVLVRRVPPPDAPAAAPDTYPFKRG
jgi:hypothetical protein